jgi:glyoxylase-like metal-dependent hydrolase (beta-lactamase superfamily II)
VSSTSPTWMGQRRDRTLETSIRERHAGESGPVVTSRGICVLAPNPGPMTLDGTNTWVLREPGARRSVVVDPGPLHDGHLAAVAEAAGEVATVLLTHRHLDHSEGARAFADRVHCGVRALDPAYRYGTEGLHDGEVIDVDGLEVRVVGTPGHTSDSLCFMLPAESAVLTGDTVLGRGTTVVAHPDGALGAYLGSLRRLRDLAERREVDSIWPGHGPVLGQARAVLDQYLAHRAERLEQIRDAMAHGAADPAAVVRAVYADVDEQLWPAAELSVRAQIAYLSELDERPGS